MEAHLTDRLSSYYILHYVIIQARGRLRCSTLHYLPAFPLAKPDVIMSADAISHNRVDTTPLGRCLLANFVSKFNKHRQTPNLVF